MRYNNVAEIGDWLIGASFEGKDVIGDLEVQTRWVLDEALRITVPTIEETVGLALGHLVATGETPGPELVRVARLVGQFGNYLRRNGVFTLVDVTDELASRFVTAPSRYTRKRPGHWTRYRRVRTIENALTVLRRLGHVTGIVVSDPIQHQVPAVEFRPLTDEEIRAGQLHARPHPEATREPTIWALGQACATSAEVPQIRIEHVDLGNDRVWSPGGPKNYPRWLPLDRWGRKVLGARLAELDGLPPSTRLTNPDWEGSRTGPQSSTCRGVRNIMARAGITPSSGVRASSLPAWTGRRIYGETGDLTLVARRMGIRSLDVTADRIGLHWQPDDDD